MNQVQISLFLNSIRSEYTKKTYECSLRQYGLEKLKLEDPSRIFISSMTVFELLDYSRRYFERKGDKSSMERAQEKRAQEIRKLYMQTIRNCVYLVRAIIPEEVVHDFDDAPEMYMKGKEKIPRIVRK
jgi:hypothetical protein